LQSRTHAKNFGAQQKLRDAGWSQKRPNAGAQPSEPSAKAYPDFVKRVKSTNPQNAAISPNATVRQPILTVRGNLLTSGCPNRV
jgi:hypothetical protein